MSDDTKPAEAVREWYLTWTKIDAEDVGSYFICADGPYFERKDSMDVVERIYLDRTLADLRSQAQVNKTLSDEVLIYMRERDAALARVAELERENIGKKFAITTVEAERDSLRAEVERLRAALEKIANHDGHRHSVDPEEIASEALKVGK